jgi:hypothetical protein
VVFVCSGICLGICPAICLEIYLGGIFYLKVMVSWNLRHTHFFGGGLLGGGPDENSGRPWNLIHSLSCRTSCRLFIHEVIFGPIGLHLHVWSELRQSPPFRPLKTLRLHWSRAFSLVCELGLSQDPSTSDSTGYMLTSFGSSVLNWGLFDRFL